MAYDPSQETLSERLYALKDIISPSTRDSILRGASTSATYSKKAISLLGSAGWYITTTAILLGLPLALAVEGETVFAQQEKMEREQQAGVQQVSLTSEFGLHRPLQCSWTRTDARRISACPTGSAAREDRRHSSRFLDAPGRLLTPDPHSRLILQAKARTSQSTSTRLGLQNVYSLAQLSPPSPSAPVRRCANLHHSSADVSPHFLLPTVFNAVACCQSDIGNSTLLPFLYLIDC